MHMKHFIRALLQKPFRPRLFEQAKTAEAAKDYSTALKCYDELIERQRGDVTNWIYRRSLQLERIGRPEEAAEGYTAALSRLDPVWEAHRHRWLYRLGVCHLRAKNRTAAAAAFSASLKLDPETTSAEEKVLASSVSEFHHKRIAIRHVIHHLPEANRLFAGAGLGTPCSDQVWTYWAQGLRSAPPIVQACIAVARDKLGDALVMLDDDNLADFADVPNLRGIGVSNAHQSDLVRATLLAKRGGFWMDATCLLTGDVSPLSEAPSGFFAYRYGHATISNWFLYSNQQNRIALLLEYMLKKWWEENTKVSHYYMFHHILEALVYADEEAGHLWALMPKLSAPEAHGLQKLMFKEYQSDVFNSAAAKTAVQKLTHKFDPSAVRSETTAYHIMKSGAAVS